MNEQIKNENEKITRAILAGIDTGEYDAEISMDELEELAKTAGAEVICRLIRQDGITKILYGTYCRGISDRAHR